MKRIFLVLVLSFFCFVLISCGNDNKPTPEVTTPQTTTPEATTPEATTPEVTTPEATTPEVTTPEVTPNKFPAINYIKVYAPSRYAYVYAWVDGKELCGTWPGTKLETFDSEWKTFDFEGYSNINIIFNLGQGQEQTADLSISSEGHWFFENGSFRLQEPTGPAVPPTTTPEVTTPEVTTPEVTTPNVTTPDVTTPVNPDDPVTDHIKVYAQTTYTHVYAWVVANGKTTELCGTWPGAKMTASGSQWNTYDIPKGYEEINIIFNNGSGQTGDLVIVGYGQHWYVNGNFYDEEPDLENLPEVGGSQIPVEPVEAQSWEDFAFWDEKPAEYWTTINKYNGTREDFRNESIYFTITTRFYDGDPSNNVECWDGKNNSANDPAWRGDFKGLIEKMDYIKALGFTAIWITPVVENASGYDYHGYHAINFRNVDERYESEDVDFQTVINEAHKRDMKIVLDVVFNHTGNFGEENIFPMFEKDSANSETINCLTVTDHSGLPANYYSLAGEAQYGARINAMKSDSTDINDIYHHSKDMSWETYTEQTGQIAGDCVDLNTENPYVAAYLVESYGEFIRMGVDAFRIDTMKHISRLTWNNYYFPALYEFAERCGNDNFFMFGEVCTRVREVWNKGIAASSAPFYTWKENKSYPWGDAETNLASSIQAYLDNSNTSNQRTSQNALLSGVSYHTPDYSQSSGVGVIDFPMHWNFQYARDAFNVAVHNDKYYNDATYNVVYVDSHDYGPDCISETRYSEGTAAWAENMSLMFTFRGIPCIYYGSEIEFQAGKPIDKGPTIALADTGRAYYGDHLAGSVTATGFGDYTATGTVSNTLKSPLAQHLIKLNKIRLSCIALRLGQYTTSGCTGEMSYIRRYTSGNIDSLALVTVSGSSTFRGIPNGTYVDLVTGDRITVTNGQLTANCSGKGNLRVYVLENSYTGTLSKVGTTTTYLK